MKPLYDLCKAASDFNNCIILDVTALQKYSHRMQKEKDAGKIKDIYKILKDLGDDVARYKEWAGKEVESMEKGAGG
ncbi:MAG: hypothetical protein OSJ73_19490 [Lachnospiraceae bacterium]|nr:hypothetical protein [Lachnospiraceae bacterium]